MNRGLITCGGGLVYFTNAWVSAGLLRATGSQLPHQLWLHESECSPRIEKLAAKGGMDLRVLQESRMMRPSVGGGPGPLAVDDETGGDPGVWI